jgi:hypothetical protein
LTNKPSLFSGSYSDLTNKPSLFSGSYTDLTNKPTIPAAQINSDWNATTGLAQILNKPSIPAAQVQSDWSAVSGLGVILNKPTLFSGSYANLTNIPTTWGDSQIPALATSKITGLDTALSGKQATLTGTSILNISDLTTTFLTTTIMNGIKNTSYPMSFQNICSPTNFIKTTGLDTDTNKIVYTTSGIYQLYASSVAASNSKIENIFDANESFIDNDCDKDIKDNKDMCKLNMNILYPYGKIVSKKIINPQFPTDIYLCRWCNKSRPIQLKPCDTCPEKKKNCCKKPISKCNLCKNARELFI